MLRPDRRELLSFLDGEIETSASIDKYAPIEIAMQRPQPYIKPSAANSAGKRPALGNDDDDESANDSSQSKLAKAEYKMDTSESLNSASQQQQHASAAQTTKELFIGRLAQKFDSSQSSRPITENIVSLSNELSIEKIVSIKLKKKAQQRTKVSAGVEIDDDLLATNGAGQAQSATGKNGNDENSRSLNSLKYNFDNANGSAKMSFVSGISVVGTDDSDTIMREIIQRERVCRNRFSVLQSTG